MKQLLSEVYRELGIDFTFPIEIKNTNGKETYFEASDGFWVQREYNEQGNETYYEDSDGYRWRKEYDKGDNEIYYKDSAGYWGRWEYDEHGKQTYYEDSTGNKSGTKRTSCNNKIIAVDGKKYKLTKV